MTAGPTITMDYKTAFFDQKAVIRSMDRASRRSMSRSLAFIRRRARTSLRRRKKVSAPGQSPSVRSTDPVATLKNILFAYDAATKSGVVGSVKINGSTSMVRGSSAVPGLLEGGGTMIIQEYSYDGETWYRIRRRKPVGAKRTRLRRATVAARPNMGPSMQKEIDSGNVMTPWANVVTG